MGQLEVGYLGKLVQEYDLTAQQMLQNDPGKGTERAFPCFLRKQVSMDVLKKYPTLHL